MAKAAFVFAIDTGLRAEEQMGLLWQWVDLVKGEVYVPEELAKREKSRTVPLLPRRGYAPSAATQDGKFVFWRNTAKARPATFTSTRR